jgi:hypothetical protein
MYSCEERMKKRARITAALFAAALASFALPRTAHATAGFPGEIQTHLGLAAQPPSSCSLCHTTGSAGGKGTVNTPFGVSVRGHGAVANDSAALDSALDAMDKDGTDSDGDKVPDITELRNGTDPNVNDVTVSVNDAGVVVIQEGGTGATGGGTTGDAPPPPQYGCALVAAGSGDASWDLPAAFGLVTLSMVMMRGLTRRRRRHG